MPEIKKFRLGGAGGYSIVAYGSKTRSGVVYERIELVDEDHPQYVRDVTVGDMPLFVGAPTEEDHAHLVALLTEARKHLGAHIAGSWFKRHGVTKLRVYVGLWGTVDGDYVTYAVKPEPLTARSLVGMTMGARKRQAWLRLQSARFLCDDANSEWSAWRSKYRIGERLRPCPGCCACWGHRISTAYGEYAECSGPQTNGKRKSQIKAMRKWQESLSDDCDGSGVLPARKQK